MMNPPRLDGERMTLAIDGMSCGHCTASVEKVLGALAGVQAFEVDLTSATADVCYRPGDVAAGEIAAAVSGAGYPARVVAAD